MKVILPVFEEKTDLPEDENRIYRILKGKLLSSSQIMKDVPFGKTKTVEILNRLVEKGYVRSKGNGRGKQYTA